MADPNVDYESVSPAELTKLLIQKHERLLSGYRKHNQNLDKIRLLEEKLDQIDHWISAGSDESKLKKFRERRDKTLGDLAQLKNISGIPKVEVHTKDLNKKIAEHENALDYWRRK